MPKNPNRFLEVLVRDAGTAPHVFGFCAGYESKEWRAKQLAGHLIEWLPEFALSPADAASVSYGDLVQQLRRAAHQVYTTKNYHNRGEIGEILLHATLRIEFGSIPAISKIHFKDASNDTVKGFDAVHVVATENGLELWLGEAKFYSDITQAFAKVISDLKEHFAKDYLRSEFIAIGNKIDSSWPHAEELRTLIHENTSLDKVVRRICVPVLVTYDSDCLRKHKLVTEQYKQEFEEEIRRHQFSFGTALAKKKLPIRVLLLLVPLHTREKLAKYFDQRLDACRSI